MTKESRSTGHPSRARPSQEKGGGIRMTPPTGKDPVIPLEKVPEIIPGESDFAYNRDQYYSDEPPEGLKIRYKIRIARGKEGERVAIRQAEAITELLKWAARNSQHQPVRNNPSR